MWCLLYWPCSSWVSLNHTTEIPQLGHQAGTGAVILKCDATVRDHACTKKLLNFHQELIYLYGLKANFFPSILLKHFIRALWTKICAHSRHATPTCFSGIWVNTSEGRIWPWLQWVHIFSWIKDFNPKKWKQAGNKLWPLWRCLLLFSCTTVAWFCLMILLQWVCILELRC